MIMYILDLEHVSCQCRDVRYPLGFKLPISFGRKFIPKLIYSYRDPVSIDLSRSLIFTLPVTKILLCKVETYFPLDSRHSMARDSTNSKLFLLITYYHAYKTLLRDGVAHRSLICCTAYGKLRLSTFFDVGTDTAAWRRTTRSGDEPTR